MDFSETFVITALVGAILVGGYTDSVESKDLPEYTVQCESPESTEMCKVIDKNGKKVIDISFTEASEMGLLSNPSKIEGWLEESRERRG